jgi:hypothetical protein
MCIRDDLLPERVRERYLLQKHRALAAPLKPRYLCSQCSTRTHLVGQCDACRRKRLSPRKPRHQS